MDKSLQRVQAAIVDGRSRTPRYIQKQLTTLHSTLIKAAPSIHQAIIRDTGCSSSEAWFEIYLTLKAVEQHYTSINFRDAIQQEYSLAHGKDNLNRRIAYGCAYVIPHQHSRFYSIVQPVSAAITAGNCVVVEMQQTLNEVGSLLRKVLQPTMDRDTFAIVDQRPAPDNFFTEQVVVAGNGRDGQLTDLSFPRTLISSPSRTIAVVDRSADISQAAKHIVRARFRFGGKSPYAPDVVFVNEFALKEFCQAAVRDLTEDLAESVTANGVSKSQQSASGDSVLKMLQQAGTTTLVSGARGSIHLLKQRRDSILSRKIDEPVLVIVPITSLDDAIDTANTGTSLLATYLFADPTATKYLSQFIISDASFTNHIPSQLLIGPPAPKNFPISLSTRYTTDMFSLPSPESINPTPEDKVLTDFLDGPQSKAAIDGLRSEIQKPLPDAGEPVTTSIGFFEQGLFTGLAINSTVLISTVGVCAWYAVPAVLRRWRA